MKEDIFDTTIPPPVLRRTPRSRKGLQLDQKEMIEHLVAQSEIISPLEIALRRATNAHEDLETIEEVYGIDSKQYQEAAKLLDSALKTALPYASRKLEQVNITLEEDSSIDDIESQIAKYLKDNI